MAIKKKVQMSTLGNQHTKDNLKRFYPFLRKEFRIVKENEIDKPEVLKELFPDDENADQEWVRAIFKFQQCDTKNKETSTSTDSEDLQKK